SRSRRSVASTGRAAPRSRPHASAPRRGFRPGLECLDERTLPTATALTASPATHLMVLSPHVAFQNQAAPIEVIALDASNHPARGYTGTVAVTSSDTTATLPSNYTFTAS